MIPLLDVQNLTIEYFHGKEANTAVRNVSFTLNKGECLALVGESGCGKSTIALSIMGLLPPRESRTVSGHIQFEGKNLTTFSQIEWQNFRGKKAGIIFQDPFSSLNPVLTVRDQIEETLALDGSTNIEAAMMNMLSKVRLNDPERIARSYPHQLSGGQRQRVMMAMAICRNPSLLIADEPTTALDVTVQSEIIQHLKSLQSLNHMAMLFVTHNLALVKNIADRIAVMRKGELVEYGNCTQILSTPTHPYTQGLIRCMPTLTRHPGPLPTIGEGA
ncbi:MAG: Oligopeptide transport ATP-binding protein OppD [Elusimicrobia bacterium]|nr:Oligopeptide transport ATP-binding protein OppD [Elusimicrobiota bacterium]